jgi:serine/threonine-protein kinase
LTDTSPTNRHRPSASTESSILGESFGDFRLLSKLGQGGMGQVYLAEQISLKRKVALKMLRDEVAANKVALSRFQAEAKTIAKLNHPNVVQAYLVGEQDGCCYLVMEYVEGVSLRHYMAKNAPLGVPLVLTIMRQVASALQKAGELGIVHRDIKPENILLTRKAEAKVADFGLSRCLLEEERIDLTRAGSTVGTPLYMSPEQIEGKPVDGRSDIYSLGVTCYQMLAGRPPFDGSNAFEVATKHVREEPPPLAKARPDVPAALCQVIHKMLAKNPDARYATARDLLKDIAKVRQTLGDTQTMAIAVDTPVDPAPTPTQTVSMPAVAKGKGLLVLGAVGVIGVIGILAAITITFALVWWSRSGRDAEPTPNVHRSEPVDRKKQEEAAKEASLAALKKTVEQHLSDPSPRPSGVDDCIDLAVRYLDEDKDRDAEAIFKRMSERKPPSAYHFAGRLGLAVIDAQNHDHKGAKAKLNELFDPKAKDQRVQILKDVQARKPEFAEWVNETTAWVNANNTPTVAAKTGPEPPNKGFKRPIFGSKFPFKK